MASKKVNYIQLMDWMVEGLKLTGNRLIIYAIIHSFSKDDGWFQGSINYLCRRTGLTKLTVRKTLKSLCDDGYLQRRDRPYKGIKYVDYQALGGLETNPGKKVSQGGLESNPGVGKKVTPIIKEINKNKIKYTRAREYLNFPQRDLDYDEIENKLLSIRYADDIETR